VTVLAADWVLPVEGPPLAQGAVAYEDGVITAVAPAAEVGPADRTFAGAAILPGFVNAHSHVEYAVYAGFGDGLDFGPWLDIHIARKSVLGADDMLAIARLGVAQCLGSGITTIGDASFSGAAAEACSELGLRAIVYLEVFGVRPDRLADRFLPNRRRIERALGDLVMLGVSPHAPYTVSPELYAACAGLGLPIATHLAESRAEDEWLRFGTGPWERYADRLPPPLGTTGIRMLAERGLLGSNVVAAHCVKVDGEEIELLAGNDVAVAHCPRSNAFLGCGTAPLRRLLDAGLRVGLGTDGVSSTPSHDMFDELRTAVVAARAREERADALGAREALALATLGSARALGLDGQVGSLTPGKQADLTVVSLEGSPYLPWDDPEVAVVFGGSAEHVILTVVQGATRYEKGATDWHELTDAARDARRRMLSAAPAAAAALGEPA
jgi:cytosine/adenosine deaminase-related metal-dependent hydrolase